MRRRTFLIGAAAAAGGLVVGYRAWAKSFDRQAVDLVANDEGHLLAGWLKIAPDDTVTVYIPHIDMGQGTHTALAMLAAEELDADWSKVRTKRAPGEKPFANRFLARGWILGDREFPVVDGAVDMVFIEAARQINLQITGGSTAVRFTGRFGMRFAGAAARAMLVEAAADRWDVPAQRISVRDGVVSDPVTGQSASFGELAEAAAELPVPRDPPFKDQATWRLAGTSPLRADIPPKTIGAFEYGIDFKLPGMLHAAVRSAPGAWRQAFVGRRRAGQSDVRCCRRRHDRARRRRHRGRLVAGTPGARRARSAVRRRQPGRPRRGCADRRTGSSAGERRTRGAVRGGRRGRSLFARPRQADRSHLPHALAASRGDGADQRHGAIRRRQAHRLGRRAGCAGNEGAADGAFGSERRCCRVPRPGCRRRVRPPCSAIGRLYGTCRGAGARCLAPSGEADPASRGGVHAGRISPSAGDTHLGPARRGRAARRLVADLPRRPDPQRRFCSSLSHSEPVAPLGRVCHPFAHRRMARRRAYAARLLDGILHRRTRARRRARSLPIPAGAARPRIARQRVLDAPPNSADGPSRPARARDAASPSPRATARSRPMSSRS